MKVETLPILEDNYVFLISTRGQTLVIDPGEAKPVADYLQEHGLKPEAVLLTHHHHDHIGGASSLRTQFNCPIYAPTLEKDKIPFADQYLAAKQHIQVLNLDIEVLHLPGHTRGHIAFYIPQLESLFSGDVIFGLGCGRLFEGTAEQMFESLAQIKSLPRQTRIYCTHEYTLTNIAFAESLSKNIYSPTEDLQRYKARAQDLRTQNKSTIPLLLESELKTNPFLLAPDVQSFRKLREMRNNF